MSTKNVKNRTLFFVSFQHSDFNAIRGVQYVLYVFLFDGKKGFCVAPLRFEQGRCCDDQEAVGEVGVEGHEDLVCFPCQVLCSKGS